MSDTKSEVKTCRVCSNVITAPRRRTLCSDECGRRAQLERHYIAMGDTVVGTLAVCETCDQEFYRSRSSARFCKREECVKFRQQLRWEKWAEQDHSREMRNEYQRRYRKKTHYHRKWEVKSRYGLEWEEYLALLDEYAHKCALCGESDDICVDHCHRTGKVRGILCRKHNAAIGQLGDDADSMLAAYNYLAARE